MLYWTRFSLIRIKKKKKHISHPKKPENYGNTFSTIYESRILSN